MNEKIERNSRKATKPENKSKIRETFEGRIEGRDTLGRKPEGLT